MNPGSKNTNKTISTLFSVLLFPCMSSALYGVPEASVGRIVARIDGEGFSLAYDGVPVFRGSLLQVFADPPTDSFSAGGSGKVSMTPLPDGGQALVAVYGDQRGLFQAEQRVEVRPDDTVTVSLRGEWKQANPGRLEWAVGRVWVYPFIGAAWRAENRDTPETSGIISPAPPRSVHWREAMLAQQFRTLTLEGRALRLRVTSGADTPDILFFDGRKSPSEWAQGDRYLWLGFVDAPVEPHRSFSRSLTLAFSPGAASIRAIPNISPPVRVIQMKSSPPMAPKRPILIPQPKKVEFTGKDYAVSARARLYALNIGDPRLEKAIRTFSAEIGGIRRGRGRWRGRGILVAVAPGAARTGQRLPLQPPSQEEGYRLAVGPEGVVLVGRDAAGAFYGLQTLRQLMRSNEAGVRFTGAQIVDWPSLRFRGAHLFVGKDALPFHKKLIERIFSRYKMNHLVLECEYTQWDTNPAIAVDFSMSKRDLAADIAFARDHFMEVTPLVSALGHAGWMFKNGQNRDIAEDPEALRAYCPNREESYRFILGVYQEAVDLFRPKWFHIGHDEVNLPGFGRFPYHPECRAEGATEEEAVTNLFFKDVSRLHAWLSARGIKMMLWSDMLLHDSESSDHAANARTLESAAERRKRLPAGSLVADWHYQPEPKERYNSLTLFQQAGFPVIATTWFTPLNIYHFAHAAIERGAKGLLQTTWAAYNSHEGVLRTENRQFTAFVLAAEYAWSGNPLPPDQLPYRRDIVFKRQWRADALAARPRRFWSLDLSSALNGRPEGLEGLPVGPRSVDSVPVSLGGGSGKPNALILYGRINPGRESGYPQAVALSINRKAAELAFVHATMFPAATTRVGRYVVVYADGQKQEIPLEYGDHIRALGDSGMTWSADPFWNGRDAQKEPIGVQMLRWRNPRPNARIRTLELHTNDVVAAPLLLAVTGMEP